MIIYYVQYLFIDNSSNEFYILSSVTPFEVNRKFKSRLIVTIQIMHTNLCDPHSLAEREKRKQ